MLQNLQYELMAALVVVTALIIYILLKKKKESQEPLQKSTPTAEEVDTTKRDAKLAMLEDSEEAQEAPAIVEDAYDDLFEGEEEGEFIVEDETPLAEKITVESEDATQQSGIQKRAVPAHGKITKQNFKEFAGERVIVAEDNLINQKVLTGLLAGSGIEIVMANNGQEALDILEKDSNFLMVLMDAHMPVMDGFEATRAIRANPKYNHILVVALSGDTAADDIKKMEDAGMAEQLEKPLRMDALYDILYAYSGFEKREVDENIVEVISTKELDGEKGLGICGGDEQFYSEILKEFVTDYGDSSMKLEKLLRNGELESADRLLLDIVGVTANIGADPLHKIATDLKAALEDTTEKSYITLLEQYNIHLKHLLDDIKNYN